LIEPAFKALIQNTDFQVEFADRLYRHLYNDGSLTDANSQARWMRINDGINGAIVGESARWGDVRFEEPITPDDWLKARDNVLAQMDGNAEKLVELVREAGYYPSIDPPEFNQHGGLVESGFELAMTAPKGRIYYTVDGSDPRVQGSGAVASSALVYDKPLVLTTMTPVKARVLDGGAPITGRPADNLHPEVDALTGELQELAADRGFALAGEVVDDVLTYALFPQVGLKFLENRGNPDAFEPAPGAGQQPTVEPAKAPAAPAPPRASTYNVRVNGRQFTVEVSEAGAVSAVSPAKPAVKPPVGTGAGTVAAALAGNVFKVLVQPGDVVTEGQTILVVEAMKMETAVAAPQDGTVADVHVREGDAVAVGDPLVTLA
jgi:biotin carboxyl carrier protein